MERNIIERGMSRFSPNSARIIRYPVKNKSGKMKYLYNKTIARLFPVRIFVKNRYGAR